MVLTPGEAMVWHSTRQREELLLVLLGRMELEWYTLRGTCRRMALKVGQCAFLPSEVLHRTVNRSRAPIRYLYVTAPMSTTRNQKRH